MNVGIILLVAVLVCMAVEVLIGVKRGIALTGVRVVLWMLGTLVAALIAKKVATLVITKIAAASSLSGANLAETAAAALKKAGLANIADIVSVPLAGLALSAIVPVVFVVLFVVAKLITLGLYFIVKAVIKHSKAAEIFTERPVWSKVAGGVVGGFVAVVTCAIIASPASGLLKTVNESGSADSLFHIAKVTAGGKATAGKIAELTPVKLAIRIEKQEINGIGSIRVYAAEYDGSEAAVESNDSAVAVIGGADGSTVIVTADNDIVDDLREVYDSIVDSPVEAVCKFTGAEGIAMAIYEETSEVTAADIGVTDEAKQELTYNFPDTVGEVMGITEAVDTVVTLVSEGNGLTTELVDSVEEIVNFALDTDIVADDDKLALLNESVPVIQETVNTALGLEEGTQLFGTYESLDDVRNDVGSVIEIAHVVAESDVIPEGNLQNIDADALINDTGLMKEFIHSALSLSNGPSMIATLINSKASEFTDGRFSNPISEASITNAGEDNVIATFTTLIELKDYLNRTSLTAEERADIDAKANAIESYGVISPSTISEVKQWLESRQ